MYRRVLWVSLTQVLRSVALVLLPTAFIALIGWATAGSSNGNTSEPMRVAVWIWLGAHHIPFNLVLPPAGQIGFLSYLPIGALLLPFIAIRSSFFRAKDLLNQEENSIRLVRFFIVILYSSTATLLAWGTGTSAVRPVLYWAPISTIPLVLLATASLPRIKEMNSYFPLRLASQILAMALGISSIVLGVSLALNLRTVENLVVVLQPGWLGGALLFLLNILYLPNAIVATLSYLVGPGFALGAGTLLSPLTYRISEIPALPLLGALPTGRHPSVLFSTVAFGAVGVVLYLQTRKESLHALTKSYLFIVAAVAFLAFLASGSLLTGAMGTVGVSTWQVASAISAELGFGIFLGWGIPTFRDFIIGRRAGRQ
ncbi:MAG: hypothetical protein HY050_07320 [Actinobacteria bacterium]|nr:hypothetical protein [Actinomycetota bacterium]